MADKKTQTEDKMRHEPNLGELGAVKNDEDIDQIMNEIESLQSDMKEAVNPPKAEASKTDLQKGTERVSHDDIKQVLNSAQTDPHFPEPHSTEPHGTDVHSTETHSEHHSTEEETWLHETYSQLHHSSNESSATEGTLTLNVEGQLNLRLKHERSGQEMTVNFKADAIYLQLTDGTELKVPFKAKRPALRRVV